MVITQFELENFKSFLTRQTLPLAPLTLLYGPNGGGKSSVIQALLALRQTFNDGVGEFVTDGRDVKLGGFKSAVSRHEIDRNIIFALSRVSHVGRDLSINSTTELHYGRDSADSELGSLQEMKLSWGGRTPGSCRVKSSQCAHVPRMTSPDQFPAFVESMARNQTSNTFAVATARLYQFVGPVFPVIAITPQLQSSEAFDGLESWMAAEGAKIFPMHFLALDQMGLPGIISDTINGSWDPSQDCVPYRFGEKVNLPAPLRSLGSCWSDLVEGNSPLLSDLVHIEPLRQIPERLYYRSGHARPSHSSRYQTVESWTDLLRDSQQAGLDVSPMVNAYLKQFGIHYAMRVSEVELEASRGHYQILLDDTATSTTVTLADVGFGMSQLLPILTHGFLPFKQSKMIAVQQPELHLHPRLQAHLADFFIDTSARRDTPAELVSFRSQWLIETHSEALVTRLQRRIREGRIKPTDVSVLYIDRLEGEGTVVTPMRLDDHGDFMDEWPGGFFEDGFDDLFGIDR